MGRRERREGCHLKTRESERQEFTVKFWKHCFVCLVTGKRTCIYIFSKSGDSLIILTMDL
jgi:hypothetical protein